MPVEAGAVLLAAAVPAALMVLVLSLASRVVPRGTSRFRVFCPVHGRAATVDFVPAGESGGGDADVVACSLASCGRDVTCGMACRGTVPFVATVLAAGDVR